MVDWEHYHAIAEVGKWESGAGHVAEGGDYKEVLWSPPTLAVLTVHEHIHLHSETPSSSNNCQQYWKVTHNYMHSIWSPSG